MKKALVTGATSFLGKPLIQKLKSQTWEVIAVVRPGHVETDLLEKEQIVFLDMAEYNRLGELTGPCDCFVHLAWDGTRGTSRMDTMRQEKNLEYSLAGIRSVLSAGCARIVLAGSQAEYGPHKEKITEESPCFPNTEYGKFKLALYQQAAALCRDAGVALKEPRFFSLYGPGDFSGAMVVSILSDMIAGRPCKLTQGIQMWDFLHIDDAAEALASLCNAPCPDGIYNFGSGDLRELRAYVEEMATVTQTKSELLFGAVPYPETGMVSLWPDVSKLKRELNWAPRITFAEGIRAMIDSMQYGG
ncbi:NAD(P)-dependent oxidoreductase [Oscillibacter valericigenes]|uniref:NAD-dependent epimerase/dehydratase family protein n=1 Tax=Oscillibacter valericigenes TaxID=351091 RepID=UPI001F32ACB8|nr:NAD(P)-dependent oxidoreductase [Oscillibacter valericigenes]MCF2617858.1 NAD(P)-dependent oxidoreductase [Oscillibacter valericigenes]